MNLGTNSKKASDIFGRGILAIIIAGLMFTLGGQLMGTHKVETKIIPPLTYDKPVRVVPHAFRVGEAVRTISNRCNNTGHDIDVEISIYWQTTDGLSLRPFLITPESEAYSRVGPGPNFSVIIMPGCVSGMPGSIPIPADLPLGDYRLIGRVCYGGITLNIPQFCAGWQTEDFTVLG